MGVPKFFRFLSERYPLLNQPVKLRGAPGIDNLFLDLNGVVHNASHGAGTDMNTRMTEDEMMIKVFRYLDHLVQMIQPEKMLYMAIDGVAPRAKMNQQRCRRFRSARDATEARAAAQRRGEPAPEGEPFDSNCITPGTPFMARLSEHLHFFVRKQQTSDPAWQRMTVILSGHEVPGEGEHKIMEHLRWARTQPDYQPNQRHCLYGLDADLIMLALVSHEPHFCLLREVVTFGGGGAGQPSREVLENPSEDGFQLLQIALLRDYLDAEFRPAPPPGKAKAGKKDDATLLPFGYDLERIIDDFVFICMLVGNDFLPPLPTLDIAEGALNSLFDIYKEELPTLGGYITYEGVFDPVRLERILSRLAALEESVLAQRARDAADVAEKKGRREERDAKRNGTTRRKPVELDEDDAFDAELNEAAAVEPEVAPDPSMMRAEKRAFFLNENGGGLASWKEAYYREKLDLKVGQPAPLDQLREAYCTGLAWVLQYYYRGVASWGWYYPFHYAPTASDLVGPALLAASANLVFEQGEPFKPFEQLLAVLPAASSALLPEPHRRLMLDPSSPIKDFYPLDFKIDFEGKRNDWEGIVQVPFIDEKRLLAASRAIDPVRLTPAERQRNEPGPLYAFVHSPTFTEDYPSSLPRSFAGLFPSRCMVTMTQPPPPLPADKPGFGPRLVKGTTTGALSPPGFPTLRTIPSTAKLQAAGCNVFGMASKKESLVLRVADLGPTPPTAAQAASVVLNSRCFVSWPYLQEALVVAVSDATGRVAAAGANPGSKTFSKVESEEWAAEAARVGAKYLTHQGIDVGRVTVLLHVRTCEGLVKHADGSLQKRFGGAETAYPLQATLRKAPGVVDPRLVERAAEEAPPLPPGCLALFLGRSHFGALAHVLEGPLSDGTYSVAVTAFPPDGGAAKRAFAGTAARFERSGALARKLRLSPRLLGQITGTVFVRIDDATRVDCGLNLKNAKHGLCVPDYCRPAPGDDGWEYSDAAARLVAAYAVKAPWLFKALSDDPDGGPGGVDVRAALPGLSPAEAARHAYDAAAWLRKQPAARRPLVKTGAVVPPEEVLRALATATAVPPPPLPPVVLERVAPLLLLPPLEEREAASVLAGGDFGLGDRVTLVGGVGGGGVPPFGARGTVVGMHPWEVGASLEVLFDVEFEGGTDLHGRVPGKRGALVPSGHCLNLTHPPQLPGLGAWGPPQRARLQPPAPPPADGRSAWDNGQAAAPASAPRGALAAAKAALTQMSASALAPPVPPPAAPKPPGKKGDAAAAAVAAAAAATARAPPAPKPAADGKAAKAAKGADAAVAAAAASQAVRPRSAAASAGGRGSGGASGPSMPSGRGFQLPGKQGRGSGRDVLRFPPRIGRDVVGHDDAAAPLEQPEPVADAVMKGRDILALLQKPASPAPAPSPFTAAPDGAAAGRAILALVQAHQPTGGEGNLAAFWQQLAPQPAPTLDSDAVAFWQQLTGANAGREILSMVQTPQPPPPPPAPISVAELEAKMGARLF